MINPDHYVSVPAARLPDLVRGAYDLSRPVGMGYLHYEPGALTDDEVQQIIAVPQMGSGVVYMDYVKGRCCKFNAWRDPEDPSVVLVDNRWFDHTENDLIELLTRAGVQDPKGQIQAAQAMQARDREKVT
jgi:hypothetical protein